MLTSQKQDLLILGIDPGTTTTGYGFIKLKDVGFEIGEFGLIETEKNSYAPTKYAKIYKEVFELLIVKHKPDVMVIERIFFSNNARTAISVGQAQGVMFLAAEHNDLQVVEYAPGTIKKVVTGDGRAKKKEVQVAVRNLLGDKVKEDKARRITKTHIDNAVDALAVALCHAFHLNDETLRKHKEILEVSRNAGI